MNKKKIVITIGVLCMLIFLWRVSNNYKYFTFEYIKHQRDYLKFVVNNNYFMAVTTYIFLYIFVIVCALPISAIMTMIGGALFGTFMGCGYAVSAATVGASLSFLLVRYFLGQYLQKKYHESLISFNAHIAKYGTQYLLLVHFVPAIPFFVINILAGLTRVDTFTFIWTTLIGIIPTSFLYAYAGGQLTIIESPSDIMSKPILLGFVFLAILALIPIVYKRMNTNKIIQPHS